MLDLCVTTSSTRSTSLSRPHDDLAETMQRSDEVLAAREAIRQGSLDRRQGRVKADSAAAAQAVH
jgi:predicted transcriptional regulator